MFVLLCSLLLSLWLFTLSLLFHCFSVFFLQKELSAVRNTDFNSESQLTTSSNYLLHEGNKLQGFL